ncbi:substrate-binding periplasmic protein [Pseudoalteromonas sp. G4]|uniref:substrate-binding periplasmic protein n=1 Tax=Pseudoalteromonas sp. G4 TaxID=2992761 RepID=UPI00237EAAB9|nr:transporter substrate-binding domain-containing protein [Pseudoalteromonas sp. G4]MDE3273063.1 transporter substrate-binding domain-containing protein [Pseudoalteromonas sp. G4]
MSADGIASSKTELSVVTEEWRPFNYTDENGNLVGRSTVKVKAILDGLGYQYQIHSYPWTRAMDMAKTDKNTLIYSIFRTAEREPLYQWVCPLMAPVKVYLFHLKNRKDIKLSSLEDAKNYITSVGRNARSHEFLLEQGFVEGVNLDVTSDPSAELRKFLAGRVDFLVQSEWEMFESLKAGKRSIDDVTRSIEVTNINERQACMAFSKNTDKHIVSEVQIALDKYNKKHGLQ